MCRYCLDAEPDKPEWKRPHFPCCTWAFAGLVVVICVTMNQYFKSTYTRKQYKCDKQINTHLSDLPCRTHGPRRIDTHTRKTTDAELHMKHHLHGCEYAKVDGCVGRVYCLWWCLVCGFGD